MSQFPTGVCVITGRDSDGQPVGMTVGSFVSVSLDPPLVGFLPMRGSGSWQAIERGGSFCVNILAAAQEDQCRIFASPADDRFAAVEHTPSGMGNPVLAGCVAWIDCSLYSVSDAGDHLMVIGKVEAMDIESGQSPLLFYQGGYGRFAARSLVAPDPLGLLAEHLYRVDLARPEMEALAADLSARCLAVVREHDDIVVAASAGEIKAGSLPGVVGQRLPFVPPIGAVFAAWGEADTWIARGHPASRERYRASLETIRKRGHSVSLIDRAQRQFGAALADVALGRMDRSKANFESLANELAHEPEILGDDVECAIGIISVPVFDRQGEAVMQLIVFDFPQFTTPAEARTAVRRVKRTAETLANRFRQTAS